MANDALQTAAGVLGNVLEWYDFGIYGYFSDTIAEVFFPPSDSGQRSLIMSYVVFGSAFAMRPVGGLMTGHVGDKHGRKRALVLSLLAMSLPTFAVGILPTFEQAGYWSTALLVACRLAQGFSVGGQLPSSLVYTLEMKPKEHWGYYGSLIAAAGGIGMLLGNLLGALMRTLLTDEQLVAWGWRLAFFTGILIAPVAAFLHLYGIEHNPNEGDFDGPDEETVGFDQEEGTVSPISSSLRRNQPLCESFRRGNRLALLAAFITPMFAGAGYYLTFVWMAIFMEKLVNPPVPGAFWVNLSATACGNIVPGILAGWLSDTYGRNKLMSAGAVSAGIVAPVMVWIISRGRALDAFFAQWAIGALLSMFAGPMCAWLPEKFPPRVRLTSISLGYNLGICLSAGFSPALATWLLRDFGPIAPGALYPFFAILALIGIFVSTKIDQEAWHQSVSLLEETSTHPESLDEPLNLT